jgi:hypothetical protein
MRWLVLAYDNAKDGGADLITYYVHYTVDRLKVSSYIAKDAYPEVYGVISSIMDLFQRTPNDISSAVDWCRSSEFHCLRAGQFPWI